MSKLKIFNDPIYGLVSFPFEFLYDLIDHPYFQRLRRIQQLGMSSIVYPGATHTRFHHALGALHLCDRLILNLRIKGIDITDDEYEATLIAILLHDIGHGPYSHALEEEIIPVAHEQLTLRIMRRLNDQFDGRLNLAIDIFQNKYDKEFLSQIISGQIDVDRMDYLSRDSFYTGVAEGIIGYDRIIKMMNVSNNQLVVEEKGIHSVEKFLLSRHFMYQQVYLHKAALAADHMLKTFFKKYKNRLLKGEVHSDTMIGKLVSEQNSLHPEDQLSLFLQLDDSDIVMLLKSFHYSNDDALRILSSGLINRKLFRVSTKDQPFSKKEIEGIIQEGVRNTNISQKVFESLLNFGVEKGLIYKRQDEIKILRKKTENYVTLNEVSRLNLYLSIYELHFVTYPKWKVA